MKLKQQFMTLNSSGQARSTGHNFVITIMGLEVVDTTLILLSGLAQMFGRLVLNVSSPPMRKPLPESGLLSWSILSLFVLLLSLFAVVKIVSNTELETNQRIMWLLIVFFIPLFGPIIYFFVRSREI